LALDLPAPGLRDVERTADLTRAAVRHIEESPRIAPIAPTPLRKIVRDATRRPFDLICSVGAVLAKLPDDGAQCANQIESNCVRYQHDLSSFAIHLFEGERPPADDLRGWATPVAPDPRRTRAVRPRPKRAFARARVSAATVGVTRTCKRTA